MSDFPTQFSEQHVLNKAFDQTTNSIKISSSSGSGGSATSLGQGKKTVTTAGTDVALATSTACGWVTIEAYRSNTGYIAVGGAGVDAVAAGDGATLAAGDTVKVSITNLASVFIDATVSGEGVRYTYGV